jgi:hypothetical protein
MVRHKSYMNSVIVLITHLRVPPSTKSTYQINSQLIHNAPFTLFKLNHPYQNQIIHLPSPGLITLLLG